MLSKQTIKLYWLFFLIGGCVCNPEVSTPTPTPFVVVSQNLSDAINSINSSTSAKELINDKLDDLISEAIDQQTKGDSTRYILKIKLQNKYLYTFPIKRSARLSHHIYKLDNAEEVYNGLEGQFNNYFYDSRFNMNLGLAKFYFEQTLPDTTLQRFLDMCVLDAYQILEIK